MRLIRGIVFFMFSCIPGCGQMHQGYMKRGISQTALVTAVLFFAIFLEMGALAVIIVPMWLYSFFDSYNLRRQRMEGTEDEDAYLFGMSDLDARRMTALLSRRHSIIGWVLVLMGLYMLYSTVVRRVLDWFWELFPWGGWLYDLLVYDAPRLVVTLLIIALGVWFIRGPKKKAPDDIPAFTPGPQAEGPGCRPEFFREAPHAPEPPAGDTERPAAEEEELHGDD